MPITSEGARQLARDILNPFGSGIASDLAIDLAASLIVRAVQADEREVRRDIAKEMQLAAEIRRGLLERSL